MKKFFTTVFFLFYFILEANSQITSREYLKLAEETKDFGEEELVNYVHKKKYSQTEIAKFFYYWVATNVSYDDELASLPDGDLRIHQGVEPLMVLAKRKTICEGYAILYQYLLSEFDVEVEVIHGVGRTLINSHLIKELRPNHAWNAVLLDGEWKLVDVTWASSLKIFKDHYGYYFDTKPEVFILNHYPYYDEWQLLEEVVSFEDFKKIPDLSPLYCILGFENYLPKEAFSSYGKDSVCIKIGVSKDFKPNLVVIDENEEVKAVRGRVKEYESYQEIIFSRKDVYGLLRLDSYSIQEGGDLLTHDGIGYFTLNKDLLWRHLSKDL